MSIPKLAIIQARLGSTRLPNKVLLPIGPETLIERVHRLTCEAFGKQNTVVAYPDTPENAPLVVELDRIGAQKFGWDGPENDVLGRFYACASTFRWRPETVIIRVTADDWNKRPVMMRRVASGARLPVEFGGEAFTLTWLECAHQTIPARIPCPPEDYAGSATETALYQSLLNSGMEPMQVAQTVIERRNASQPNPAREHLTTAIFGDSAPPKAPPGVWEINTQSDYDAVCQIFARQLSRQHHKLCVCETCNERRYTDGHTGDISDPQMGELHDVPSQFKEAYDIYLKRVCQ